MKNSKLTVGSVWLLNCDSCEAGIEDYNVRINSPVVVVEQPKPRTRKVLVTIQEIDGNWNVTARVKIKCLKPW